MHVYEKLLPRRKLADKYGAEELSLSAYVLLAVAKKSPLDLLHHNVFFSSDYRREFEELIGQRRPPSEPTVYLCAEEEQYFLLSNAPPLPGIDWKTEAPRCRERII